MKAFTFCVQIELSSVKVAEWLPLGNPGQCLQFALHCIELEDTPFSVYHFHLESSNPKSYILTLKQKKYRKIPN